jgi:hypothetical protein
VAWPAGDGALLLLTVLPVAVQCSSLKDFQWRYNAVPGSTSSGGTMQFLAVLPVRGTMQLCLRRKPSPATRSTWTGTKFFGTAAGPRLAIVVTAADTPWRTRVSTVLCDTCVHDAQAHHHRGMDGVSCPQLIKVILDLFAVLVYLLAHLAFWRDTQSAVSLPQTILEGVVCAGFVPTTVSTASEGAEGALSCGWIHLKDTGFTCQPCR